MGYWNLRPLIGFFLYAFAIWWIIRYILSYFNLL